jgi:UDP-N-acetylglucosamine--N-acetylmuramyl-(pentapeptide) pyrophosphoryl-undecaprenol N-acetylglucosamine transferase
MASSPASSVGPLAVVIAGGGTGGHLYPGLAVAEELQRQVPGAIVTFAGTARGLEARVVPQMGLILDVIRSAGLKGKGLSSRMRGVALLAPGFWDAWRILSRRRPHVVVGVGGYSSGPVVFVAALRGIPTLVLEQNAVPGLTNRLLSRVVRSAALTYEEALPYFRGRGFVAGNPVRAEFFVTSARTAPSADDGRDARRRRVLILGGSQGAHAINLAMVAAAPELVRQHAGLQLVHQTGDRDISRVRTAYAESGVQARAAPFLDHVADEMREADLVVCRAGATTLAELAAVGRAAVLVPFPAATDDHQRKNARVLAGAGAAALVEQQDLSSGRLAQVVGGLLADEERLGTMAAAMSRFARPDAARHIVARLLTLAGRLPQGVEGL